MAAKKKGAATKKRKNIGAMRGVIHSFTEDTLDAPDFRVSKAIVDAKRITMDWTEDDDLYFLSATSTNGGLTYDGHLGFPQIDPSCQVHIRRFTAINGRELLLAKWHRTDDGEAGLDIIELSRAKK